jgi:glycosyltransferase involved in cell wall biosynthesis
MRILQVCEQYFPSIGGVQVHVKNISERLAREHDVTVFTIDSSGLPREEELNGVLVRRFSGFYPNNAYYLSLEMLRELRKAQFDIVHGHNYHAFPLFLSRYAKKKRFIVTSHYCGHGATVFRHILLQLYRPFGKNVFHEADKVIALSDYEKGALIKDFQIESSKIVVIPNGVNLKEFRSLEKKQREHSTILYVGRFEKFKGIQYVIQAMPLLDESIRLVIVGKGPYKERLIRQAMGLGVAQRVSFHEDIDDSELLNRYVNADLLVQLSKYEAFAIVVAEALASKVPCIVANTSALKEWVDGQNCFGIDYPISIEGLARLISQVMGRKAGGVKLWDWNEVVAELTKVYQE